MRHASSRVEQTGGGRGGLARLKRSQLTAETDWHKSLCLLRVRGRGRREEGGVGLTGRGGEEEHGEGERKAGPLHARSGT